MSSKTKILVIKMREIIYTVLFLAFLLLLVILLVFMFTSGSSETEDNSSHSSHSSSSASSEAAPYIAGVYTSPLTLGNSAVDVEVMVDEDHINSIRLVHLSETAAAMYPLISPSLEDLARQVCQSQTLDHITSPESSRYTSQMLLNAISSALEKARASNWE